MTEDIEVNYFDSKLLDGEIEIQKGVIERNKDNPIVKLGFAHRVGAWIDTILPDRMNQIDKEKKDPEFVNRMGSLAINDFKRLLRRSEKEGLNKRADLTNILYTELLKYSNKKDEHNAK